MMKKNTINDSEVLELQKCICEYEDETAYKKLFFIFFLPLKSFSYSIIKSKEQAEEIVSDIFIKVWMNRKQLTEIENLRMYLYISVRNLSVRRLQQKRKSAILALNDIEFEFASTDANAESVLLTDELRQRIEESISNLPERCKLIFKLAKEDQLKYREIAQLLNVSVKTIDSQLAIALKRIAQTLNISLKKPSSK